VTIRTRFAPSPTGDLHLGGAWAALASWVVAKRAGGRSLLRVEDIDRPRVVQGARERIEADLAWLGLGWDEAPVLQSERSAAYEEAVDVLSARGLVYPCDCSRAEIARVASAPHPGEDTPYPGLCRDRDPARVMKRPPALRFRVADEVVAYDDAIAGHVEQNLADEVGDFVLRRGDGVFAYQLAVVVDDLAMAVTDVVRGADLLSSAPRQIALARALGGTPPRFAHVPMVVTADGARLEKRTPGITIRSVRERGLSPERVLGALAGGLGLAPTDAPAAAAEIAARSALLDPISWRRTPWPVPPWLSGAP
jgi:glutamyl-tRNA synthetase